MSPHPHFLNELHGVKVHFNEWPLPVIQHDGVLFLVRVEMHTSTFHVVDEVFLFD